MDSRKSWKGRLVLMVLTLLFLSAILCAFFGGAFARTEARYLMRAGDAYFGNDLYNSRSIQTLFHQQGLNVSDKENFDLKFPVFADGLQLGPTSLSAGDDSATANILPFGPVNLAFPSLHEDVTKTVSAAQTGFFTANYNYRPEIDYGNVPLTHAYPFTVSQAICPAPLFGGLPLYPEQTDTWWLDYKAKELNKSSQAAKPPANATASNQTSSNQTRLNEPGSAAALTNQTIRAIGIPQSQDLGSVKVSDQIKTQDLKDPLAISYFKAKNATTPPWETLVVYGSVYDLAGRDGPVFSNPGIGTFSTNGAGSTCASLTGVLPAIKPGKAQANQTKAGNQTPSNQTTEDHTMGNQSIVEWASGNNSIGNMKLGNLTLKNQASGNEAMAESAPISQTAAPAAQSTIPINSYPAGNSLTYAGFNFDASTGQINDMSVLERMWRNSHRGGTMGKAYVGDTSMPGWIDPYERPYDVSMLDEHWYCLQSALDMTVPGTQILPRLWSLGMV